MNLNDEQIQKSNIIKPFKEENLTPNGYDVTIEKIEMIDDGQEIWSVMPKTGFIVLTNEIINMPENLIGNLWLKTKWARQGIILSAGVVDAGFKGKLNLCCYNSRVFSVSFNKNDKFVQLILSEIEKPKKSYSERSGNYQNQKEIIK